jgi:hypothetical protein
VRRIDNIWIGMALVMLLTLLVTVPLNLSLHRLGLGDGASLISGAASGVLAVLLANWLVGVPSSRH